MSEDKYRAALDMAAKQLSYRALSAKMLRDKLLAKGHDEEAADYALAWLTERSMLNDELFAESGLSPRDPDAAALEVLGGIERLAQAAAYTVVVTVDVFADGMRYDEGTEVWRRALACVNAGVAALADRAVEVVCGIPVWMKGEGPTR